MPSMTVNDAGADFVRMLLFFYSCSSSPFYLTSHSLFLSLCLMIAMWRLRCVFGVDQWFTRSGYGSVVSWLCGFCCEDESPLIKRQPLPAPPTPFPHQQRYSVSIDSPAIKRQQEERTAHKIPLLFTSSFRFLAATRHVLVLLHVFTPMFPDLCFIYWHLTLCLLLKGSIRFVRWTPDAFAGWGWKPARIRSRQECLPPHEETGLLNRKDSDRRTSFCIRLFYNCQLHADMNSKKRADPNNLLLCGVTSCVVLCRDRKG